MDTNKPDITVSNDKQVLELYRGDDALGDIRDQMDEAFTMATISSAYEFGGHNDKRFDTSEELLEFIKSISKDIAIIVRLYVHDDWHPSVSLGSRGSFSLHWDPRQVGVMYILKDTLKSEWGTGAQAYRKAMSYLKGEIANYNYYLNDEVWGYVLKPKCPTCGQAQPDDDSSCWGFYGPIEKSGILDEVPEDLAEQVKQTLK